MNFYLKFFENIYQYGNIPHIEYSHQYLHIPKDVKTILDVGCGKGYFLNSLPEIYKKVGVDCVKEVLGHVKCNTVVASIDFLPFKNKSFDLVTCFEVLEHLPWHAFSNALKELERVSKKYIAISVPNKQNLSQGLVTCPNCLCRFNPDWHVRSFEPKDLFSLFSSFLVVEIKECGPFTEDYPFFLDKIFQVIIKKDPPPLAVCPQCGFSKLHEYTLLSSISSFQENNIKKTLTF